MKRVTLVELTAFDKIIPLASAYLCGYARQDQAIADHYAFRIHDAPVSADRFKLAADLTGEQSDVYALSCYLWNMGLVRWLLDQLIAQVPHASFILGGPQVMNQAAAYVAPDQTNVVVCNGEGERTFARYLAELLSDQPDMSSVPGISFWRRGELVTTERPERIRDLTEVPSPFTGGFFAPDKYTFAILETNRGCPYNCGFCFWGAATNAKVNRFEDERVLDDITWISEHKFTTIFLADANWGMAPRDVEFTKHIVECSKRTGYPLLISMNAAKNKPDRVADITRLLVDGGLLTSQPISLQSMDSGVLKLIDRSNIRTETYTALQQTLREQAISSYIEMIWPLPGETTATFRDGLTELCRSRADTILVYPQLLLHNTPIYEQRDRLGVRVRRVPDDVAEADVVVATNWVTEDDYAAGVWIYYAMVCLYNLRGLYYLANYLDRSSQMTFGDLFASAARFLARHGDSEIVNFIRQSVDGLGNYYLLNGGRLAHLVLHAARDEFDHLLTEFVTSQPFWADTDATAVFELDLLARPYIYRERPRSPDYRFRHLGIEPYRSRSLLVTAPDFIVDLLADLDFGGQVMTSPLVLAHPAKHKLPYLRHKTLEDNISYCQGMTLHLREMLPSWTSVP